MLNQQNQKFELKKNKSNISKYKKKVSINKKKLEQSTLLIHSLSVWRFQYAIYRSVLVSNNLIQWTKNQSDKTRNCHIIISMYEHTIQLKIANCRLSLVSAKFARDGYRQRHTSYDNIHLQPKPYTLTLITNKIKREREKKNE